MGARIRRPDDPLTPEQAELRQRLQDQVLQPGSSATAQAQSSLSRCACSGPPTRRHLDPADSPSTRRPAPDHNQASLAAPERPSSSWPCAPRRPGPRPRPAAQESTSQATA
ncbi:hypothetical protein E1292_50210 [Nonomuraea deserti]|uniref:Uncharacterized protein n=1 Tax=Nonomuraea deserti TaxID=1848322 RepID=A0A4R4TVK5_9ACTN|nr:hypothetical protein E1292_50210 [Nonomuraea deserti]